MDRATLADIKRLAEAFRAQIAEGLGVDLGYDQESVAWVDGYVDRMREHFTEDESRGIANVIGCYLGEAMVVTYGFEWYDHPEHGWGVRDGTDGNIAFPVTKAHKHFADGPEDSILSFFRILPIVWKERDSDARG